MRHAVAAAILTLWSTVAGAGVTGYYRFPAIHGDTVVFTAEGDLWTVGVEGGVARRLTSHLAQETNATISPDGSTLAFAASYEGPTEVYTMPLGGGLPVRRTFAGGRDVPVGWDARERLLISTRAHAGLPDEQLVALELATGARERLPLAQAADGCTDDSGAVVFFTRLRFQGSHTRRYRGGTAQQVWRYGTGDAEATSLTADFPGTSKAPMWWRGRVYFVSDRDGTMNLWSMRADGSDLVQHTRHDGWDVASPALAGGRIVYQLGADLRLYEIDSARDRALSIELASDLDQLRQRFVGKPMDYLTDAHLSPDGDRVVLTARGQVFVAPVKQGRLVEATRRQGVRYRSARFLDGTAIAALSDETGETEWWRLPATGVGERVRITSDATVLRFDGLPSPDGAHLAYEDKDLVLWVLDVETGRSAKVATSPRWGFGELAWSPDSRWLAYSVPGSNTLGRILLYDVRTGGIVPLTSERTHSFAPAWSADGKWIYFLSNRNLETAVPSPWGTYQPEPFYARPTRIMAVALTPDERFPFRPVDELAPGKAAAKNGAENGKEANGGARAVTVRVVAEGLTERLYEVPIAPGNFSDLAVAGPRLLWLERSVGEPDGAGLRVLPVECEEPEPKTLVENVTAFEVSADGKQVLVRRRNELLVFEAKVEKIDPSKAAVDLEGWTFLLDPREEFRQMFVEAWRLERDYFYDRAMHGVDWPSLKETFLPLVARVTDRAELSDLLGQMVGELSALHTFVRGGDQRDAPGNAEVASLGAELVRDEQAGGVRVAHVWQSDADYPSELSPLARPGVGVRAGDVITLIDGVPVLSVADPALLLRNRAGKQVLLRVLSGGTGAARDVIVQPITAAQAADLRYGEWELTRRQRVERASDGRFGYVHLRAMGGGNWEEFARQFYPVFNREGLIIDVRHNRGGNIDSWVLEKLMRKAWFYWQPRVGDPYWNMQYAFRGHMVVLVDQFTASDGEAFAEGFRRLGLGPVIGVRTWGGEIWLSSSNFLVDKGIATAAETGVYGPEGEWLIEGWGVEPDIVVDNLPRATFDGRDAQLEEAIRVLEERLAEQPVAVPPPPAYPDKSGRSRARVGTGQTP